MLESIFRIVTVPILLLVIVLLFVGLLLFDLVLQLLEHRRVEQLGYHAPLRQTWLPFGLDAAIGVALASKWCKSLEHFQWVHSKFGNPNHPHTVELRVGMQRIVMTRDEENIKAILATMFHNYGKGEEQHKVLEEFLGDSIFSTDGELWHRSRQLIRPQFIKDRISDLKIFEKHISILLPHLGGDGTAIDVSNLFYRFTLDAITDFLLGRSVDSITHERARFAEAFNETQRFQGMMMRAAGLWRLMPRRGFRKQLRLVNEFVESFVEDALAMDPAELEKHSRGDHGYTFLHAIAKATRDRKVLRDQLIAVLLAGRDTTAATMSWMFYEMSSRPHVVQKLRREILETVGLTEMPSYANLKAMKNLQHCISETLRLYPVVPFNLRYALTDTYLPHGGGLDGLQPVGIPAGTPIGYSTLALQRRPELYPSEAEGFPPVLDWAPERWENWNPKPWQYIPWNGGPRICVGQQFAITEMAYTTTRILQAFERIENRMPGPARPRADITLFPAEPVLVGFYKAGNGDERK